MKSNIEVKSTNERILPSGGMATVGCILETCDFINRINLAASTGKRSSKQIKDGDILASFIALECMARPDFEAVREMNDDPDFYKETLGIARIPSAEILRQRMDEIGDSKRNLLLKENIHMLRANGVCPTKLPCGYIPVDVDVTEPREGKKVYIGSTWKEVSYKTESGKAKKTTVRIVYEITERTIDKYGQYLLLPDIEVNTWWMNLPITDRETIELYHAHGQCEQYHSEFKSEMNLERLPSEKLETNALVIELGIIAYNILRMIGQESIGIQVGLPRHPVRRRRLRTVIDNLIMIPCHVISHARKLVLGLGKSNFWREPFIRVHNSFAQFAPVI